MTKKMRLCSACLLGIPCRYDGERRPHPKVFELAKEEILIPICPEQLGGLPTPREGAERRGEQVVTKSGKDVTEEFKKGASCVVEIAKILGVKEAVLKQKSPSCGCGIIYDGTFSKNRVPGNGVTAQALIDEGVHVITEEDL